MRKGREEKEKPAIQGRKKRTLNIHKDGDANPFPKTLRKKSEM